MPKILNASFKTLLCFFLFCFFSKALLLFSEIETFESKDPFFDDPNIQIDLKEPEFSPGLLKTEKGGVLQAPNIRIQARSIVYISKIEDGEKKTLVKAEGDLFVEFGEYVFTGDSIEYDFTTSTGTIINGKSAIEPWYFGGEVIQLSSEGSLLIRQGFLTTSETLCPDWSIEATSAELRCRRFLSADKVCFKILKIPLLYVPCFKLDLNTIFDSPIRYTVRFGGQQGTRLGVAYELWSWNGFKALAKLDYRFKRGFGGGIESQYRSPDRAHCFQMINYIANDNSICDPKQRVRYRFQGIYNGYLQEGKTKLHLCYDKLSDKDMAEDYYDETLDIDVPGRTELKLSHLEETWISSLFTRVRINTFQSLKQDLPTAFASIKPFYLPSNLGILSEYVVKLSYLDYDYANTTPHLHDYRSSRFSVRQNFYRPFILNYVTLTPETGLTAIYYGDSPSRTPKELVLGRFDLNANTRLSKRWGRIKHVVEPFTRYSYQTMPTTAPFRHFIFDIEDGLYRLNYATIGVRNAFYDLSDYNIQRPVEFNVWTYAFFQARAYKTLLPKAYAELDLRLTSTLRQSFFVGWNFEQQILDCFNLNLAWTASDDLAIATEYRHRSRYSWRKDDPCNFNMESFLSENVLLHSSISDRRDTLLFHTFWRFYPNWALEFQTRIGWNRIYEPNYRELQVDLHTFLGSAWKLKISYQLREDDHRLAFYFKLAPQAPSRQSPCYVPMLDF